MRLTSLDKHERQGSNVEMTEFLVMCIAFLAIFIQTAAGFGIGLISMPLLIGLVTVQVATPLVALLSITSQVLLVFYYREALNIGAVLRLSGSAIVGIPFGVLLLDILDGAIMTPILGIVVLIYALYALLAPRLPELSGQAWTYSFGLLAGILGGAYNLSGTPIAILGTCRNWPPTIFKSNLQGFFVITNIFVVITHFLSGNFTTFVWQNFLCTLPGIALGILAGIALDKRIDPQRFRQMILVLLIFLSLRLIF